MKKADCWMVSMEPLIGHVSETKDEKSLPAGILSRPDEILPSTDEILSRLDSISSGQDSIPHMESTICILL